MRLAVLSLAALAMGAAAGAAQAAQVEIDDAVARVVVAPENRTDVVVEVIRANPRLPLDIRRVGDRVVVNGDVSRVVGCVTHGGRTRVRTMRGEFDLNDMPQILVRTPRQVSLEAEGAVFGEIGRASSVDLSNSGCGDWTVANVAGRLAIRQAGSGDARAGAAGEADLSVAGSGDIAMRGVEGRLEAKVAGSGDIYVETVTGPADVTIAGSGDVKIGGGRAGAMNVSIAGSGDVDFGGDADSLQARVMGSGDVRARAVRGQVTKMVMGSGNVVVGR